MFSDIANRGAQKMRRPEPDHDPRCPYQFQPDPAKCECGELERQYQKRQEAVDGR